MTQYAKIAITLPVDLLKGVERERRSRGESRSAFFRLALEAYLRREREREWDEQYRRAYREVPEGADDEAWARAGIAAIAGAPWEDGGDR